MSDARPTLDDIRKWPATVSPAKAALAFGISRSYAYELARSGDFPCRVIKVGSRRRVSTADILRVLSSPADETAA
jgi:predicted DNA-binding transcriptional regulator AlpA